MTTVRGRAFRGLEKNRAESLLLIASVASVPRQRRPTKPTHGSVKGRLEQKGRRAAIKAGRRATE